MLNHSDGKNVEYMYTVYTIAGPIRFDPRIRFVEKYHFFPFTLLITPKNENINITKKKY